MNDSNAVRRELLLAHPREAVWRALTDRELLAQWLHPNDFEARLGHRFTFRVPPKPEVGFEGLVVQSEVLELDPPNTLVLAWNAEDPVADTRVSFRLEDAPDGKGTRLRFEHTGFNLGHPYGAHALQGAQYGWGEILGRLEHLLSNP